jgi:hypothetical protein
VFISPTPTGAPVPPFSIAFDIKLFLLIDPVAQGGVTAPHCPLSAPLHQPLSTVLSPKAKNASYVLAAACDAAKDNVTAAPTITFAVMTSLRVVNRKQYLTVLRSSRFILVSHGSGMRLRVLVVHVHRLPDGWAECGEKVGWDRRRLEDAVGLGNSGAVNTTRVPLGTSNPLSMASSFPHAPASRVLWGDARGGLAFSGGDYDMTRVNAARCPRLGIKLPSNKNSASDYHQTNNARNLRVN